jgi:ribosome-associated heat shock protein Hsp15
MTDPQPELRIDKWLWAVRLYKTRSLATEACRAGKVSIGGQPVKAARATKIGDVISAKSGDITRTVKVLALADKRVGPKLVDRLAEDQTPASEYLKQIELRKPQTLTWPKGSGRPTKKDRRDLEKKGLA